MKKLFLIAIPIFLVSAFFIMVINPYHVNSQKEKKGTILNSIPDSLHIIFTNSCMPCHFEGGSAGAKLSVNFSEWNKYPAERQFKKGESICKIIKDGNMPPKSFRESKPNIALTKVQVDNICKWSSSLKKK
jgi:hypothetical protein